MWRYVQLICFNTRTCFNWRDFAMLFLFPFYALTDVAYTTASWLSPSEKQKFILTVRSKMIWLWSSMFTVIVSCHILQKKLDVILLIHCHDYQLQVSSALLSCKHATLLLHAILSVCWSSKVEWIEVQWGYDLNVIWELSNVSSISWDRKDLEVFYSQGWPSWLSMWSPTWEVSASEARNPCRCSRLCLLHMACLVQFSGLQDYDYGAGFVSVAKEANVYQNGIERFMIF